MTAPKRPPGRPRSAVPRATVCLRIGEGAYAWYVDEAARRNAAEPHRGRPVGHTEIMREVLEDVASKADRKI